MCHSCDCQRGCQVLRERLLWTTVVWSGPASPIDAATSRWQPMSAYRNLLVMPLKFLLLYRATAAAGRARKVEESPAACQVLPKRGEAWARSRADMQFMQEGHVYFTDSVCSFSENATGTRLLACKQHVLSSCSTALDGEAAAQPPCMCSVVCV